MKLAKGGRRRYNESIVSREGYVDLELPIYIISAKIHRIVVLKSTLKLAGGDGTESSPYTLGV